MYVPVNRPIYKNYKKLLDLDTKNDALEFLKYFEGVSLFCFSFIWFFWLCSVNDNSTNLLFRLFTPS